MRREPFEQKKKRSRQIAGRLKKRYPDARCWLNFHSPFELFVATVLSAQCTDARVNGVTKDLFRKYRKPADYATAKPGELEHDIRSTGFFNNKAKSLRGATAAIVKEFDGELPSNERDLLELPGVGRKTANVILGNAFGKPAGMVVDTHVGRIARRLGLTTEQDSVRVEAELNLLFPAETRAVLAHRLIQHGRQVCTARRPKCATCFLAGLCPKIGIES